MDNSFTICFYGSSDYELQRSLAELYKTDIDVIVDKVLDIRSNNLKIITGGYGGIMDLIAEKVQSKKSSFPDKNIEVIGVTCDAYDFENPDDPNYNSSNDYSKHNDIIIQANSFADRIQAMTELSDLFIVLPGKQGSLGELLLTCESYAFGKYILNDKKAKLFVHDFWKPLLINEIFNPQTKIPYFRNFNADVLDYFNIDNIETRLSSLTIQQELNNVEDIPIRDIPIGDYVQSKFIGLKNSINRTVLGRLYDDDMSMTRIRINKDTPMLGLDFGWFLKNPKKPEDGGFYSYSAQTYREYTSEFFASHNSIMLNDYENEFKNTYLNGISCSNNILELSLHNEIPKKDRLKTDGDFNKLKDFFYTKKYGQTLIWKGFRVTQNDYTKKQGEADEILFSIFLLLNHKIPKRKIEKIRQLIDDFLLTVSSAKSGELFQEKQKEIEQAATRAAISQVMARNTSHNIGAHVMNKLIGDLSSLNLLDFSKISELNYQSTYEKDLKKLHSDIETKINDDPDLNSLTNGQREKVLKHKILLAQISLFNNYVKCRMDYLADISFGTPLMQTNKYAYEDLFKRLDEVRLLLEHISGLDSFKYEIQFKRNGQKFKANGGDQDDLLVAIPNDILGTQAFYNILENIIRNTAKHSDKTNHGKDEHIVFTVNFIDEKPSDATNNIEDILNGFVAVEVYDNIDVSSKIDELVLSQNNKLNENILDNNKLRSSSLGLVEMDASAAYLRKRDVGLINDDRYDIEHNNSWRNTKEYKYFLKAFKKDNHLAYRFFLHRPAVVLVITEQLKDKENDTDEKKKENKDKKDKLKKEGIWVVTPTEFEKELKGENGKPGKVYPHEFVLYEKQENREENNIKEKIDIPQLIGDYKTSLPIRVLEENSETISEILKKEGEKIICDCWLRWDTKINTEKVLVSKGYSSTTASQQAVFLDHLYDEDKKKTPEIIWNDNLSAKHLEALSSFAQQKMPDFNQLTKNSEKTKTTDKFKEYLAELGYSKRANNYITYSKVIEAVQAKVIVIDERIQNTTKEPDKGGRDFMTIPFKCLYAKMGVIVPDVSLNLSENSFATIKERLEQYIEEEISGAKSTDFILIHYSILERMYDDKTVIKNKLEKWSNSINVVVTSGRGIPDGLTEKVRFVNLSSVITAFVDVRSKYAINYLLNSSRKSNKI